MFRSALSEVAGSAPGKADVYRGLRLKGGPQIRFLHLPRAPRSGRTRMRGRLHRPSVVHVHSSPKLSGFRLRNKHISLRHMMVALVRRLGTAPHRRYQNIESKSFIPSAKGSPRVIRLTTRYPSEG